MKSRKRWVGLVICCGLLAVGCSRSEGSKEVVAQQAQASVDMTKVEQELGVVAGARILFGHQSVGRNVLAGLDGLIAESTVE